MNIQANSYAYNSPLGYICSFFSLACQSVARATSQTVLNGTILVSFIQLGLLFNQLGLHQAKSDYPDGLLNKHTYHPHFPNSSQLRHD